MFIVVTFSHHQDYFPTIECHPSYITVIDTITMHSYRTIERVQSSLCFSLRLDLTHYEKAGLHQARSQTVLTRPEMIYKRVGNA